jgi:predicted nucleic acid-binding protein
MNVYVETNFVLEHALERGEFESCRRLLTLASEGSIQLVVPAFSLAEPHDVLRSSEKVRRELGNNLKSHLDELGRSQQYSRVPAAFSELTGILFASGKIERDGLQRTTELLLSKASGIAIIPLDVSVLRDALQYEGAYWLSAKDSIVLASILRHLKETKPAESCFLNRNTKDFDDRQVRDLIERQGCKFFGKFEDGLRYVKARLQSTKEK